MLTLAPPTRAGWSRSAPPTHPLAPLVVHTFIAWMSIQIRLISLIGDPRTILTTNNQPMSQSYGWSRPNILHIYKRDFFLLNALYNLSPLHKERISRGRLFGFRPDVAHESKSIIWTIGHLFANLRLCCFNPVRFCWWRERSRINEKLVYENIVGIILSNWHIIISNYVMFSRENHLPDDY